MRKYLPTLSELVDRLSIIQLKEVFITDHKSEYADEISKIIKDKDGIEIAPSMIQLMDDIKSLGEFKVNINLHSEVQAEIKVKVIPAEIIQ